MQFNSIEFLVFFPLVVGLYFTTPHRFQWLLLLLASCLFYMAFVPEHILVLLAAILIDYYSGRAIEQKVTGKSKYLSLSIGATILLLVIFKYLDFGNESISSLAKLIHWNYPVKALHIILPLGLSFYKLQSLGYVIEVYRGRQKAERHFGIYSLYVMFFPQLIAGPIERPYNMLHQFREEHRFEYGRVTNGLKLMAWGFFKKLVVADRLALIVNQVYNTPTNYSGLPLIVATIFFAYQIYCDFSGYSDIAIGAAQVMGFRIMDNFHSPYSAKSIPDFWARWHISLSSWLRDYVFLPVIHFVSRRIEGDRLLLIKTEIWAYSIAAVVTMLLAGLWHGASWTYVFWGAIFAVYLLFSVWTRNLRKSFLKAVGLKKRPLLHSALTIPFVFFLVCIAWIFFRANSVADGFYIIEHSGNLSLTQLGDVLDPIRSFLLHLRNILLGAPLSQDQVTFDSPLKYGEQMIASVGNFLIALTCIIFVEISSTLQRRGDVREMLSRRPALLRWSAYYALIMAIILFGAFEAAEQFIYFQF